MEEQKKRSGFVKFIDNVGSNLLAGSHDLVAGIAGTAGLLTGSKAASEFAAEKAGQAERTTAALQHTGNDGLVNSLVGGGGRALPAMAAAAATGGTAGAAAMGFTQGAGTTYADLYKHQREKGLSHAAASQAATGAAMASGAVSAALGKVFSGGAQALNNPATREAAKKGFGAVLKSALKGAADEIPQEVLDGGFNHVVSEMSKGKTAKEAAASYLEQLPENMLTAGVMGGGVHAGSDLRGSRGGAQHASTSPTGYVDTNVKPPSSGQQTFSVASPDGPDVSSKPPGSPQQPRSPGVPITPTAIETGTGRPSSQQPIPENTTKAIPGSGSAPQPPTPSSAAPADADAKDVGKVLGNIQRLKDKARNGPLSLDEQRELDHHEKVLAQTRVKNLEKEQQVIRSLPQPRELDPHKTQVLADAKAVLARPVPGEPRPAPASSEPPIPDATTRSDSDSGKPSQTTANTRQPPQTPPAPPSGPPPDLQTAQERIHNIMNRRPEERGHPTTQADLAQAQQVVADHVQKLENQPGPLSEAKQKELTDAKAALARLEPPEGPATSTHSSGGSQPAVTSATTNGDMPAESHVTGTLDAGGTTVTAGDGGQTSTASSNSTTSGGTHTTNGVKAPPVGYGELIPENTTHPEHIDLATRRVGNLEEVARNRPLDSHEQGIYDNARRVRDRNTPLPQGTRNTSNPQDLVMAGGDGPSNHTHGAAADAPPPAAPAQPANAIGSTINAPGSVNPDAPKATAGGPTAPPPAGPVGTTQTGTSTAASSSSYNDSAPSRTSGGEIPPTTSKDAPPAESNNPPGDYPHAADGDYRGNWKTSTPGRRVKLEDGQEGIVTYVAKDHTLTVDVNGKNFSGIPQQKVKMQLTPAELAAEQAFIKRQESFQKLKPVYDQRLTKIAESLPDAHVVLTPLKGAPRALEKAGMVMDDKRNNGKSETPEKVLSKFHDILRGSIVVDSLDQVPKATTAILHSFAPDAKHTGTTNWGADIYQTGDGRKVIVNDRFKNPTKEGYSDVQIMLEMTPGHMVEIQVHIPEMLVAKEGDAVKKMGLPEKYWPENMPIDGFDPNRTGHHMYEESRSLPKKSSKAEPVSQEMKTLYQAAMDAHFKRHLKILH